jgi:hypothetical protein
MKGKKGIPAGGGQQVDDRPKLRYIGSRSGSGELAFRESTRGFGWFGKKVAKQRIPSKRLLEQTLEN